jgi:hypothetical protein
VGTDTFRDETCWAEADVINEMAFEDTDLEHIALPAIRARTEAGSPPPPPAGACPARQRRASMFPAVRAPTNDPTGGLTGS